ncbi:FUSC family protein [Pseudonocardia nematodicida]|uniref:FUSC family protein n=1 Tax=Pseudonocardia nematodicida TaxID=1206997 RepID=A0ABV1KIF1_9PSEU
MTSRWTELRTRAAGIDPGRTRLHLASVATAAMLTAALLASGVRAVTGAPVTVVLFAVVLAMISNLAVQEQRLPRRRVTTALMILPAGAAATVSALLSGHRLVADIVFVLVTMVAVVVRRYGNRGTALGMAAFMAYFFVQFLHAGPADLPLLLVAAVIGIGSTFVLRCLIFTRSVDHVLDTLVRAFEARLHALARTAVTLLEAGPGGDPEPVRRAQARLNETALLVADRLDDADDADDSGDAEAADDAEGPDGSAHGRDPGGPGRCRSAGLRQWIVDTELAAERLAMAVRRSAQHGDRIPGPDRAALAEGIRAVAAATAAGTPRPMAEMLHTSATEAVEQLAERSAAGGPAARQQRIAFAVVRLADALGTTVEQAGWRVPGAEASGTVDAEIPPRADRDHGGGPALHTRQAVQVGIAVALAIVVGELISPARWYWAVVAAFVVFAGTSSRGDVLSRGWARAVGTAGGVVAGMLLAVAVGGNPVVSLVLLFACVFLALYLVRISQAMMAFWITSVLALLYGVIGQFSVQTMVLRIEETLVGGALGMLAAFLVLPTRSRTAFAEALDDALDAVGESLRSSVDRAVGRPGDGDPTARARAVATAVGTVRDRARPLEHPVSRRPLRRGVHHTVRVVAAMDHYCRLLAAQAVTAQVPGWASTLDPAAERVRANVAGLSRILDDAWGPPARRAHPPGTRAADYGVVSAEELVDAAEADAASRDGPGDGLRQRRLAAARWLRRIDQLAVGLARELCGGDWNDPDPAQPAGASVRTTGDQRSA